MLGSLHDADDALQDALLRAWRGLHRFEGRSAISSWLYRIATNSCLDAIAKRPKRLLPVDYGPPADPAEHSEELLSDVAWIEPYPDTQLRLEDGFAGTEARYEEREGVELAFIAALQHLPPRQRATLILRDVLCFSAREVAEALDTTVPAINSALQRARNALAERLPQRSQQATARALGDEAVREVVSRFTSAFEQGDVDAILALLTDDVTFSMPPSSDWCRGRDAVADSWLMPGGPPPRLRYATTSANGQPAVGTFQKDPGGTAYRAIALDVLALRGHRIAEIIAFRTPEIFPRFGLPLQL